MASRRPAPPVPPPQAPAPPEVESRVIARCYRYKAKAENGQSAQGYLTATTRERAAEALYLKRLTPLELVEVDPDQVLGRRKRTPRVSRKSLAVFTRQLAILYKAGIPLARALDSLGTTPDDRALGAVLVEVRKAVQQGFPLSRAMQRHPQSFPPEYTALVEAGEVSGMLDTILERMSATLERQVEMTSKIRAAMTYPAFVTALALVLNMGIFKWILPQFEPVFESAGIQLPLITAILMQFVRWTNSPLAWVVLVGAPVGAWFAFAALSRHPLLREPLDRMLLRFPVFGPIYQEVIFVEIFTLLHNLFSAGLQVQRTLKLSGRVANNRLYEKALGEVSKRIQEGDPLGVAFNRQRDLFPRLVIQMITMGEATGRPTVAFEFLADFYRAEVAYSLDGLSAILEPFLIALVGIMTGTVVMAVLLPIYKIVSSML